MRLRRRDAMRRVCAHTGWLLLLSISLVVCTGLAYAQDAKPTSYAPVVIRERFESVMARMSQAKPEVMKRQMDLLSARYDLSDTPAGGVTMSGGKAVQEGPKARPPEGLTWQQLGNMSPAEIQEKGVFPAGFLPLPHPNHPEGGMVFPLFHIEEILKQEGRDLTRYDLDFDLSDHFLV